MFSGTQEKCATCGKTAYPLEKVRFKNLGNKLVNNIWSDISVTYWIYEKRDHTIRISIFSYYSPVDEVD